MTLTEEQQQISVLWSGEIDKYENVTSERTLPYHQSRLIEQAKFIYSSLGKAVEKQVETIKDQGEKPIKLLNILENSYLNLVVKRILNNFKRKRKFSEELANERIDEIQNLRKETDFNNLIYYFKGKSNPKFFICFNPIWTGLFGKCLELGGGLVGQRWKNMLYIRKFLFVLHEILYICCIDKME